MPWRRASITSRPTTPSTSTASRCATACGSSPPSTSPRTDSKRYPILLTRTPYSVGALRRRSVQVGPRPVAAVRQGRLHLRLPGRARPLDVGGRVRQHAAASRPQGEADRHRRKHATPTTRSTGWSSTSPATTARSAMWGISYPGFYTAAGMIDAHPALKAASPQAPVTDWFVGDDWHHNGALFLPHVFNFLAVVRPPAARADARSSTRRSTTARPTATTSSSSSARSPTPTAATSRTTSRSGTR